MAPQKSTARPIVLDSSSTRGSKIRVAKKRHNLHYKSSPGLKRRNGLLNTAISARSAFMQMASRNSQESLLLRLPGEIRNIIWTYAVGGHLINIRDPYYRKRLSMKSGYHASPLSISAQSPLLHQYVSPTFKLPQVCRQIYCESSSLIYTQNCFAFGSLRAIDNWIKNRPLGQKRLVTSIDVPFEYMRLYYGSLRKFFREKFPSIKRIGVHSMVLYLSCGVHESEEKTMTRIADNIKMYEGQDIDVVCHGRIKSS
ncbi:hypothetical protein P153DRAFT_333723 [Dothidotthia symphoricarpi CBS 119687]|uniref:DUF7730 domain-containing protein n=1 Tax=Dothidotthia symphoricarpi CBS 119687 TaxID=1392245 RepID=A0A6A6AMD4_9PLEO|nr:uncharacterized protein P153DRAFT_333723 [Dothidotthia symphoricarpi CBS 119687]KAF2132950.1 hypothetical protein P153DRAFT_333723 [Dothidotthia symphoricarpi CBS 119687]